MISRFERFSFSISVIYRYIQSIAGNVMEEYRLKGSHALYLSAMYRYPEGITAAELCRISGRDKAAISRAINEMEKQGLIYRECVGGNLYRAKLMLTEQGRTAADNVNRLAAVAVDVASEGISDEQRKMLYEMLDGIATHLQALDEKGLRKK